MLGRIFIVRQYRGRCMSTSRLCSRLRASFFAVQQYRGICMSISRLCGRLRVCFCAVRQYRGICVSILSLCSGLLLPAGLRIGSPNGPRSRNGPRPITNLSRTYHEIHGWACSNILRIGRDLNLDRPDLILGSMTFRHRRPDLILGSMTFRDSGRPHNRIPKRPLEPKWGQTFDGKGME